MEKIITDKKSVSDERVGKLEEETRLLMKQLRKVESEKKQLMSQYEKHRKRMKRNKNIGGNGEVLWEQCLALLSNVGGISRLFIFNDNWHSTHPDGARLLWGYNSWREAKLYVNVFFGNEVDTTYDPSDHIDTSGGALKLPNLSSFEKCMACRMFFHVFPHEQIIALCLFRVWGGGSALEYYISRRFPVVTSFEASSKLLEK